ncbi:MAG: ferrous iron transport protein B [Bacteroidota bacterium]
MRDPAAPTVRPRLVALTGNPNSGKSTVFNALTGLRQRVSNYPGVTVERREGRLQFDDTSSATLVDLPGTYSLSPTSIDERIAVEAMLGNEAYGARPDIVICVVDANSLERNLYLVSQIIDREIPVVVALNMIDVAGRRGTTVDVRSLERELGVPVVPMVANKGEGVSELKDVLSCGVPARGKSRQWMMPEPMARECGELSTILQTKHHLSEAEAFHEALELFTSPDTLLERSDRYDPALVAHIRSTHKKLDFLEIDCQSSVVTARYKWVRQLSFRSTERVAHPGMTKSDRLDWFFTHRIWGVVIFLGIMGLIFHSIFSWAAVPMEAISAGFDWLGKQVTAALPPGDLRDLLVNGALAGVAAVVTFLPQIMLLFFFLGILEDSGYMARAAYVMDRLMGRVGLHGKSFIPLLSSFACAVPGIMAARTIDSEKDRLVTILVAPLLSCSARLPVYTLLIGAFIPATSVFGLISLPALTLMGLYSLGLVMALAAAWFLKKTILKSAPPELLIELPPYRIPSLRHIVLQMWERAVLFLRNAGTIILGASIILWFLASYPRLENATPSEQLQQSLAGKAGHLVEPLIKPLGFNWKIGIGLIGSLLQREVFVSTMGTIYNIQKSDQDDETLSLQQHMKNDRDPTSGVPTFTTLTAICLMIYYVLAMQCLSTVAVMRRETNGWKWPAIQVAYMTALTYSVTLTVYTLGTSLGWGG